MMGLTRSAGRGVRRGFLVATMGAAVLWAAADVWAQQPAYSKLWGERGEAWSAQSRLPDFSFAGYERGEAELPSLADAPRVNVRDFGARPDDGEDDTAAFQKALEEIDAGVVEVPPGRYVITDFLDIDRSNVVLRGAGEDETTLHFPKTLTEVKPNWGATTSGQRTSNYSWSGGFVRIRGGDAGQGLGPISESADRGERALVLERAAELEPGDTVRLTMRDDDEQSLADYLYAGDHGPIDNLSGQIRPSQVFRLESVEGKTVHLDRPLRFDVRAKWRPALRTFEPRVTHSGIEGFTFDFPTGDYEGHFTELGHNGIAIGNVAHCWVRNVRFENAESGIFVRGRFCTLSGITINSDRTPGPRDNVGHHAVTLGGEDNLLTDFAINARYIHDITVSRGSFGNVSSNGSGVDLNFDHHRRAPYENLFTNIDTGKGSRVWSSGGGGGLGRHAAARNTYWNLRGESSIPPPPDSFGPAMLNVVGVTTDASENTSEDGPWFEPIAPDRLHPQNLHEAQLERRLEQGAAPR